MEEPRKRRPGGGRKAKTDEQRLADRSVALLPSTWREVENMVQRGEYRSVNAVIRAALAEFLNGK